MCYWGDHSMIDIDYYDEQGTYSGRRNKKVEQRTEGERRAFGRRKNIERNIDRGVWFTGEKISEMTTEHLANAIAMCKRKRYWAYIPVLEAEFEQRMKALGIEVDE